MGLYYILTDSNLAITYSLTAIYSLHYYLSPFLHLNYKNCTSPVILKNSHK